jgi:hypothetical protein
LLLAEAAVDKHLVVVAEPEDYFIQQAVHLRQLPTQLQLVLVEQEAARRVEVFQE